MKIKKNGRKKDEEQNNIRRTAQQLTNSQTNYTPTAQQQVQYTPTASNKNPLSPGTVRSDLSQLRNGIREYQAGKRVTDLQKQLDNYKKQPAYKQDRSVNNALKNLNSLQRPGEYTSAYGDRINSLLSQMENDNGFTYDPESDPLYNSYRDQYMRLGQRAMEDSMGNAAALTGGYGNTYAQSVGQQSYQDYLTRLNDQLPNLYNLSYQNYRDQVGDRQQLYNNYAGLEDRDYGRYQDTLNQYNVDRNYLTDYYRDARDTDYGRYRDSVSDWNINRDYLAGQLQNERNYDLGAYDRARQNWQDQLDLARLQLSNMDKAGAGSGSGSGGGGGAGGGNGGGNYNGGNGSGGNGQKSVFERIGDQAIGIYNQQNPGGNAGTGNGTGITGMSPEDIMEHLRHLMRKSK